MQALLQLVLCGKVAYIVTQNVDALHRRSGIPEDRLAELHGCCFIERCPSCKRVYLRDFEVETVRPLLAGSDAGGTTGLLGSSDGVRQAQVGFKPTGRKCTSPDCTGRLQDWVLDWESALPEDLLEEAERQTDTADLCICLGTSLQIEPVNQLPGRTQAAGVLRPEDAAPVWQSRHAGPSCRRCAGGKLVIVNLQETDLDLQADLVVHAKVDLVMSDLAHRMNQVACPVRCSAAQDARGLPAS